MTLLKRATALIIVALLTLSASFAQQIQKSLLWRITGKHLQPSYLFGTMHLTDRRIFNLPDSLYIAMDNCDAFALEVNPDSLNTELKGYFQQMMDKARSGKKLRDMLDKKELQAINKNLPASSNVKVENLTVKQAYLLKEELTMPPKKADDMPTFLDAFLFKIAKDKGRHIAGLELLQDQMNLLTDLSDDFDPKELLANFKNLREKSEDLVTVYRNHDLQKIQQMVAVMPVKFEDLLLTKRNRKMLHSMDSIMENQTLFAAVGAAHLPGKTGLIELLRNAGYTVQPVIGGKYTHASKYQFKNATSNWVDVKDDEAGYSVSMPGTPVPVNAGGRVMKIYMDITSETGYYTFHIYSPSLGDSASRDSTLKVMIEGMRKNVGADEIKGNPVTRGNVQGTEYTLLAKGFKFRIEVLINGNDLFMQMVNSKKMDSQAADQFFRSFTLHKKIRAEWSRQTLKDDYLSILFPGTPEKQVSNNTGSLSTKVTYSTTDPSTGIYYTVVIVDPTPGNVRASDSSFIESYKQTLGFSYSDVTDEKVIGPAYTYHQLSGRKGEVAHFQARVIFRGNRYYTLIAGYESKGKNQEDLAKWFGSATLLPMPGVSFDRYTVDSTFTAYGPSPFIKQLDSSAGSKPYDIYVASDTARLVSFSVVRRKLDSLTWVRNDSATLRQWVMPYAETGDALVNTAYHQDNTAKSFSATVKSATSSQQYRIKTLLSGDVKYTLVCAVPDFASTDASIDSFFTTFKILTPPSGTLRQSSDAFFAALHTRDTAAYKHALSVANEIVLLPSDLPALISAFGSIFPLDTLASANEASDWVLSQLKTYKDSLSVSTIDQLYLSLPPYRDLQKSALLTVLAAHKDSLAAFDRIKHLLVEHPSTKWLDYSLMALLREKPWLTKNMFSELVQLTADTSNSNNFCRLVEFLVDSNHITHKQLQEKEANLINNSKGIRVQLKKDDYSAFPDLLAMLNTPSAWAEIKLYQFVPSNSTRNLVTNLLMQNKYVPDAGAIAVLCADPDYRVTVYDSLKAHKLLRLFPEKYKTQVAIGESILRTSVDQEDNTLYDSRFITEQMALYNGKLQKFLLYRVKYGAEDKDTYLGVIGPFSSNPAVVKPLSESYVSGIANDPMTKEPLNKQLKAYLYQLKENVKVDADD